MLAFLLAVTVACNKDDDAPCTDLGDTLIGSWSVTAIGLDLGDVEFKSDGTLIDPDDVLIGGEVNGIVLDEKSYTVTVSYTHLRAHETVLDLVCRLLLEKKKK